jgi:hypothetical protein
LMAHREGETADVQKRGSHRAYHSRKRLVHHACREAVSISADPVF